MGIKENCEEIRERIVKTCKRAKRNNSEVKIIGIAKGRNTREIREAYECGIKCIGENRIEEAGIHRKELAGISEKIEWHFVGHLQGNKARKAVEMFEFIDSVDSLKLAEKIDRVALELNKRQKILIELNIADEESKSGFSVNEIEGAFAKLIGFKNLKIRGFMCIPPEPKTPEDSRKYFIVMREIRKKMESMHTIVLPVLSMGMSMDFEVAIEEGASEIRIGRKLFE